MSIQIVRATPDDASAIARVRTAASAHLTERFGGGHWSMHVSEGSVRDALQRSVIVVARAEATIVGALRLQTESPGTIEIARFTPALRPLYIVDVAVQPAHQRQGIGRRLLDAAYDTAIDWPGHALRLGAYDAPAGAGDFYRACGFRQVARVIYRDIPLLYFECRVPRRESRATVGGRDAAGACERGPRA